MSSPYRDAGGDPCPRCGDVLATEANGDLACAHGCGAWVPHAELVTLLGDVVLRGTGGVPYWKLEPFPDTPCLRCAHQLDAVYAKLGDGAIAIGQCVRHGVWVERGTRAELVGAYSSLIAQLPRASELRLANPEPRVASLEDRVAELEARVAKLEQLLAAK